MSYWQAYRKVMKTNTVISLCFLGIVFIVGLVASKIEDGKSPE